MARLIFQNLAICNNQNLPPKMCPNWLKNWQMSIRPFKNWPNAFKIWPKWRNFAKSGHTGRRYTKDTVYYDVHIKSRKLQF